MKFAPCLHVDFLVSIFAFLSGKMRFEDFLKVQNVIRKSVDEVSKSCDKKKLILKIGSIFLDKK